MSRVNMKKLDDQIALIDRQIQDLQMKKLGLMEFRSTLSGEPEIPIIKKRATNVKPMVLDIMGRSGSVGATSAEVFEIAKLTNPAIGRDTVSSVLSRLKSDGALTYSGERYYEKQYAPALGTRPFEPPLRSVN